MKKTRRGTDGKRSKVSEAIIVPYLSFSYLLYLTSVPRITPRAMVIALVNQNSGGGDDGYERDRNTGTRIPSPRVDVHGRVRTFLVPSFFVLLPFLMTQPLLFSTVNEEAAWRTRPRRRTGTNRDKWPRSGDG